MVHGPWLRHQSRYRKALAFRDIKQYWVERGVLAQVETRFGATRSRRGRAPPPGGGIDAGGQAIAPRIWPARSAGSLASEPVGEPLGLLVGELRR